MIVAPYMVPKFYIPMNSFPKLPSHKTDRKTLLAMVPKLEHVERSQYSPGSSPNEPVIRMESPEEQILRRLWAMQFSQDIDNLTLGVMASCMRKIDTKSFIQKEFLVLDTVYDLLQAMGVPKDSIDNILSCPPGKVEFLCQCQREQQFRNLLTVRSLPSDLDLNHWIETTTKLSRPSGILRSTFLQTSEHGWLHLSDT
jgi:hypothetical protein